MDRVRLSGPGPISGGEEEKPAFFPGPLLRNRHLRFQSHDCHLRFPAHGQDLLDCMRYTLTRASRDIMSGYGPDEPPNVLIHPWPIPLPKVTQLKEIRRPHRIRSGSLRSRSSFPLEMPKQRLGRPWTPYCPRSMQAPWR